MALSFRSAKLDRDARELSRLTGKSMTEAVEDAVGETLERVRPSQPRLTADELEALLVEVRKSFDFNRPITKADFDAMWNDSEEPFRS